MLSLIALALLLGQSPEAPPSPPSPQAVIDALAIEDWTFVDAFWGEDLGLHDTYCIFRSKSYVVAVKYCAPTQGGERRGDEVASFILIQQNAQTTFYVEGRGGGSVYDATSTADYSSLNITHEAFPTLKRLLPGTLRRKTFIGFSAATRWVRRDLRYSLSTTKKGTLYASGFSEPQRTAWKRDADAFVKEPGLRWGRLLAKVRRAIDKHGRVTRPPPPPKP